MMSLSVCASEIKEEEKKRLGRCWCLSQKRIETEEGSGIKCLRSEFYFKWHSKSLKTLSKRIK